MKRLMLTASLFACIIINATSFANVTTINVNENKKVQAFIDMMANKHQFDKKELQTLFGKVHLLSSAKNKMNKQFDAIPWYRYRNFFITNERIQGGVKFWNDHAEALSNIEKTYGVPAKIVVAIIGIETYYGKNLGHTPVIDALATFAFNYPRREKFFTAELENYLLLAKDQKFDPLTLKGSYAGAIGFPQFMPSSYRHYAVDYDDSGTKNLYTDNNDVLASVAYYFKKHGWHANEPIAIEARFQPNLLKHFEKLTNKTMSLNKFYKSGLNFSDYQTGQLPAQLIVLDKSAKEKGYWLILHNFKMIKTYNNHTDYAMATYQLSEAIEQARQHDAKTTKPSTHITSKRSAGRS